jgi:hypothetical protein
VKATQEELLVDEILKQVVTTVISALVLAVLGQWGLTKAQSGEKPPAGQIYTLRAVSLLIGVAGFVFWRWGPPATASTSAATNPPVLQSVQAKPNSVNKGGRVTVTVQLDRPAPRGGVSVVLNSSDPAILTVDGNAPVPQGRTMGTAYSRAIEVPTYPFPVTIVASLNDATVQTEVNVTDPPAQHPPYPNPISGSARPTIPVHPPVSNSITAAMVPAPKPAPLDAELIGRLEEAQGRLSAEKAYWEDAKHHMPAGTSLRPEINSQLFAADSTARRCTQSREASDAASLTSCIDALNDHLTQLSIQH